MAKIVLDTKALLDYLAGNEATVEKVKQYIGKEELCITALTLFEVTLALRNEELVRNIEESFTVLDITKNTSRLGRSIYLYIEERRKPSMEAALTAAACIENKAYLLPGNRADYIDIPKLKLI